MSHTLSIGAHSARDVQAILKGARAALTGRDRGPDHAENWRVPHRDSHEVSTTKAQPWAPIGDGSVRDGLAHREALVATAEQLRHKGWLDFPLRLIREKQGLHDALTAELVELGARAPAEVPTGRPATIRRQLGRLKGWLDAASLRLRETDVGVLRSLLHFLDFRTGQLFPGHVAIAGKAGRHRNTVIAALRRLAHHGLVSWVRRTVRTGTPGVAGPQLEQTSNAYHFEHRQRMEPRVWQTFSGLLSRKLGRLGQAIAAARPEQPREAPPPDVVAQRAAVASFGASVLSAST